MTDHQARHPGYKQGADHRPDLGGAPGVRYGGVEAGAAPVPADAPEAGDAVEAGEPDTRLILVRHGHARAVDDGVVAGHRGCTGLSELGRRQAEALSDRFVAAGFRPDAVVTSVLPRAVETAEIVAAGLGVDPARIPHLCALCELHPGEGDGLTWDAFVERYGAVDPLRQPDSPLSPGGESARAFRRRVEATVAALAERHAGQTVVAVVHGGVILAATLALLGLGPRRFARDLANSSVTEWVRGGDGGWLLRRFNDAAHLEALPRRAGADAA